MLHEICACADERSARSSCCVCRVYFAKGLFRGPVAALWTLSSLLVACTWCSDRAPRCPSCVWAECMCRGAPGRVERRQGTGRHKRRSVIWLPLVLYACARGKHEACVPRWPSVSRGRLVGGGGGGGGTATQARPVWALRRTYPSGRPAWSPRTRPEGAADVICTLTEGRCHMGPPRGADVIWPHTAHVRSAPCGGPIGHQPPIRGPYDLHHPWGAHVRSAPCGTPDDISPQPYDMRRPSGADMTFDSR